MPRGGRKAALHCSPRCIRCFFPLLHDMGAAMGKPHRLPAAAWVVLGVLIGLHLPVLKSLFGNQLLSCTGVCPQQQRNFSSSAAPAGPAAAFGSFVYPTWPVNERSPTVRALWQAQRLAGSRCCQPLLAAAPAVVRAAGFQKCCLLEHMQAVL